MKKVKPGPFAILRGYMPLKFLSELLEKFQVILAQVSILSFIKNYFMTIFILIKIKSFHYDTQKKIAWLKDIRELLSFLEL